jgi:hypothetical protein
MRLHSQTYLQNYFLWMVLVLLLLGCDGSGLELAPVSGRVAFDGKPLAGAEIVFQPDERKPPSYGFTDQRGRYELGYTRDKKGALVGWHTVRIASERSGPRDEAILQPQSMPERYNVESELRREVERDKENVFDFELTSEPNGAGSTEPGARRRARS